MINIQYFGSRLLLVFVVLSTACSREAQRATHPLSDVASTWYRNCVTNGATRENVQAIAATLGLEQFSAEDLGQKKRDIVGNFALFGQTAEVRDLAGWWIDQDHDEAIQWSSVSITAGTLPTLLAQCTLYGYADDVRDVSLGVDQVKPNHRDIALSADKGGYLLTDYGATGSFTISVQSKEAYQRVENAVARGQTTYPFARSIHPSSVPPLVGYFNGPVRYIFTATPPSN